MFDFIWQDIVLALGNVVFFIALLPSIFSKDKPSFWTGLMTATMLTAFTVTYVSLGLWAAVVASAFISLGWWTLTVQKYLIDNKITQE